MARRYKYKPPFTWTIRSRQDAVIKYGNNIYYFFFIWSQINILDIGLFYSTILFCLDFQQKEKMTASVRIISFVCLGLISSALTGPLVRESCVNESKNRVARDFRTLIDNGRDYHKNLVRQRVGTAAKQQLSAAVQPADSKSEFHWIHIITRRFGFPETILYKHV